MPELLSYLQVSVDEHKEKGRNQTPAANACLLRGFFPRLYQQETFPASRYYQDYVATYVERDVRQMIHLKNLALFQDFLQLIAGRKRVLIWASPQICIFTETIITMR